jgi:acyl carrier protein
MTRKSTKEVLKQILGKIAPEANLETLAENENIRESLGLDSFDFLNFMIAINENLGLEIPESDYGKLNTIRDLVVYIEANNPSILSEPN